MSSPSGEAPAIDIDRVRASMPSAGRMAYFDTAAASVPARETVERVTTYLRQTAELGPYDPAFRKEVYRRVEAVRQAAAAFLNAAPAEVAFVKNTTEGISIVAQGIAWKPGDEVVITNFENLSNIVPWRRLARYGVTVRVVEAGEDCLVHPEALAAALTPKTRLFAFSHIPNATGAIQPAAGLCRLAREHGVLSLVCAAESLGMLPTDVRAIGCDFLAACGRKALRAIEGSGLLYVREALIGEIEPCLVGWWNGSYDMATGQYGLVPTARRFEAGCPIVPAILSLEAALEDAARIGVAAIEARVRMLTRHVIGRLAAIPGFALYGPPNLADRIGIVPFNIRGIDPQAIVLRLGAEGVIIEAGHFMAGAIMQRYGIEQMARVSVHYFNTEAEIDRAAALISAMTQQH
jgi:cysteine desulfurase/selenocysteine lyase